ncbi:uncharacterized protein CBL_07766 [Carabus blaptoides fortunei]
MAEDSIVTISYPLKKSLKVERASIPNGPADYEAAMSAAGFGKYNLMLLIVTLPSAVSSIFATTAMSFIMLEAQCDLDLSLEDKGLLNAITYMGMITSAFAWGIVGDTYGRRTVLLYSYSFDSIFCFLGSFSTQKWMLILAKYCSGFVMCGPVAVLMTFLAEFHCSSFRPNIITILGIYYGIARTLLPLLAWWIMPLKLHAVIIPGIFEYKSWQIFLIICCIPALISGIVHYCLPETPKFLMTKGKYDKALELFRKIYSVNTGKDPDTYPITELQDETYDTSDHHLDKNGVDSRNRLTKFVDILETIKPLFFPPYLCKTFLMCGIFFGGLLSGNTWRLWLPQLFTTMDEYSQAHNYTSDATLCEMLDYSPKTTDNLYTNVTAECIVSDVNDEVYINNTIVPVVSIFGYFLIGALVTKLGKKTLLIIQYTVSGILVIANYWARDSLTTVILSSLFLTFFSICATTATSIAVELFPTNFRTMATSIALTFSNWLPATISIHQWIHVP